MNENEKRRVAELKATIEKAEQQIKELEDADRVIMFIPETGGEPYLKLSKKYPGESYNKDVILCVGGNESTRSKSEMINLCRALKENGYG